MQYCTALHQSGWLTSNWVEVGPVGRSDLGMLLTCQASNNNRSAPLVRQVGLDLFTPPLDVSIVRPDRALSAGRQYQVLCTPSPTCLG